MFITALRNFIPEAEMTRHPAENRVNVWKRKTRLFRQYLTTAAKNCNLDFSSL
jgi:hypothetical protein